MKTMAAGKFKDLCLKTLDEVARTRSAVVITKRGRPVAKLVPCRAGQSVGRGLAGSVLERHWGSLHHRRRPGMLTLLDTHAWVWWVTDDRRLSRRPPNARSIVASRAGALALSLISVWEVAKKVEKGSLVLDRPVADWLDLAVDASRTATSGTNPTHSARKLPAASAVPWRSGRSDHRRDGSGTRRGHRHERRSNPAATRTSDRMW